MKQTSPPSDLPEQPPVQKMTRRGFIKRTAATALAVVLAMNAFEAEAAAADEGGSSGEYLLELISWPEANITYWAPDGHQEVEFNNIDQHSPLVNYGGFGWQVDSVTYVSPNAIASTKQKDGAFHFMTSSFSVNITVTIRMYQGANVTYQNTFTASGTVSASIADPVKGLVSGSASCTAPISGQFPTAEINGKKYVVFIGATAIDGNHDPLGTSVSPSVGLFVSIYERPDNEADIPVTSAANSVSFTWQSFWVPK